MQTDLVCHRYQNKSKAYFGYVSCHTANNIPIITISPAPVRIFAILVRLANAKTPETANGNTISHVIANASAALNRSGIFGLIVVTLARIKMPTITDASI